MSNFQIEFYCPKCQQDFTPNDLQVETDHGQGVVACPNCENDVAIKFRVFPTE